MTFLVHSQLAVDAFITLPSQTPDFIRAIRAGRPLHKNNTSFLVSGSLAFSGLVVPMLSYG